MNVTLNILCTNDTPVLDNTSGTVSEDAATGTVVMTLSGSDVDGDALSYAITAGNGDGIFAIS